MEQAAPRPARSRFHTICHNPGEKESPAFLCHPRRQAERYTHGRALLRESPGEAGIAQKAPRPLLCATCKEARLCAEGCGWQRDYQPGLDETGTDSKGGSPLQPRLRCGTLLSWDTPALRNPCTGLTPRDTLNQGLTPRAVSMATWHPGGAGPANWGIWMSLGTWQCRGGWRKEDPAPQEAEKHLEGKGGLDLRRPCPAPPATLHLSSVSEARRWPVTGHPSPQGAGGLPVGFGVGGSRSGMQNAWGGPWQEGGQSATPSRS